MGAVLAGLGLAACAQAIPPASPPLAAASVEGKWQVVAVNGRPTPGSITIEPPLLRANFGCNDGRGSARIEGNRLVIVMAMAVTERGCMNLDGGPADSMLHEAEGFRIASRAMQVTSYGPDRVRLSNAAGTIDLVRP